MRVAPLHVALVVNPASGKGRAALAADALESPLRAAGITVSRGHVDALDTLLGSGPPFTAVLLVGGDGTVHHALPALRRAGVPLWHVPTGTENLFARGLGHSARPDAVLAALRAARTRALDLIEIAPASGSASTLAAIMLSLGPDAGVIARLDAARTGPITHASYLRPALAEAFAPALAPISLWADGRTIVRSRPGWLVIANMRPFGARIDPCPDADPSDGLLDALFLPATSTARVLLAMFCLRAGLTPSGALRVRAREFILLRGACPAQADGEVFDQPWSLLTLRAVGTVGKAETVGGLRVLAPA